MLVKDTMNYEEMPFTKGKVSRKVTQKEVQRLRESNINHMSSLAILWFLAVKHKFGIVVTILIVYVALNSFGTLIIGLVESIK